VKLWQSGVYKASNRLLRWKDAEGVDRSAYHAGIDNTTKELSLVVVSDVHDIFVMHDNDSMRAFHLTQSDVNPVVISTTKVPKTLMNHQDVSMHNVH
jgi:hypothetical protein